MIPLHLTAAAGGEEPALTVQLHQLIFGLDERVIGSKLGHLSLDVPP
jgi:hypothetical protein